jgi:hypothetical protein
LKTRKFVGRKRCCWKRFTARVSSNDPQLLENRLNIAIVSDTRKLKSNKTLKDKEVKCNILQSKSINFDEEISKETELETKIQSVTPAKFSAGLKIEEMSKSLKKCLNLLKTFYENLETSSESQSSANLWIDIKNELSATPNIFVFQAILKQISSNNAQLETLQPILNESQSSIAQQLLPNLSQRLIISGVELLSQKSKLRNIKTMCSDSIKSATEMMMNSTVDYSFQYEEEDDIVGDFVAVLLNRLVLQGKLQHGRAAVSELKRQVECQETAIKDYALTTQDTRNIYKLIDEKVLSVQQAIAQMYHINEKLNFGKISMLHLVQDLKTSCKHQELNRTMMNLTLSMTTSVKEIAIPTHRNELQMFLELPMDNLDFTPDAIARELKKNCLLLMQDDESIALLAKQTSCDILNINRCLQSIKKNFESNQLLLPFLSVIEPKFESLSNMSITDLKKQRDLNREAISELLDEISKTNVRTKSCLRELEVLYQYLLTNPLKKFVPSSKKFDGKTYKEYENDFSLYYKMIKD